MNRFLIEDHSIIFDHPEKLVFPFPWVEHIPFAFFLVDVLRPSLLVELGVHTGNSYNAFCQSVKKLQSPTKCVGIDIWKGDYHAGFYSEEVYQNLKKYQEENYNEFSSLLKMYFDEACSKFSNKSIDLLHIDGLHTYEAVKHDYDTWLPKMSDKGVIIFHDTQVFEKGFGVNQFFNEIRKKYTYSFEFLHGNGLGVLITGENVNEEFKQFIVDANKSDFYRGLFSSLGRIVSAREDLKEREEKIDANEKEIRKREEKIFNLKHEIIAVENDMSHCRKILRDKDNIIQNLEYVIKLNRFQHVLVKVMRKLINPLSKIGRKIKLKTQREYNYVFKGNVFKIKDDISCFNSKPLISVVVPVFNVEVKWLDLAVQSVKNQLYENWELILVDDASDRNETIEYLQQLNHPKIKTLFRKERGNISSASNDGVAMASGEYIALLDHDDELTPDALYEVARSINETGAEIIYSDEDKIDEKNAFCHPHFKPDFSLIQLYAQNYICHLTVIRRDIINQIGGFRIGYEGAQDYDLILRAVEKTNKITHVPKVLYHWRMIKGSTSKEFSAKSYANEAGLKALQDTIQRNSLNAEALPGKVPGVYRVKRRIDGNPMVSIIIPFKDKSDLLKICITSILRKTTYKNFEIIGISNNSEEDETLRLMDKLEAEDKRVKFYEYNIPFNYSKINNYASTIAAGSHLLLLNNDIEIITPDWIESLLEYSQLPEVGAVGAKLYYPNRTIQHGGVIIGISGVAGHSHKQVAMDSPGYFSRLFVPQNLSAVTAACLMVKKSIYTELNGLNEENLKIAFNDVDFCLRLREKGYSVVFTPYCEAYHHESVSRGYEDTQEKKERFEDEIRYMRERHNKIIEEGDPFYNPNLTLHTEDFALK